MRVLIVLLSFLSFSFADIGDFLSPLTGRVVDNANILNHETKKYLTETLRMHEQNTTNQVVIASVKSLDGYEIEPYANALARHWALGQKDKNNGVLLLIAPNEKKVRIEVGYGLEGYLTDKISHEIINYSILPEFKKGDFNKGVMVGVRDILSVLNGSTVAYGKARKISDRDNIAYYGILFPFLMVFVLVILGNILDKPKVVKIGFSLGFGTFAGIFALEKISDITVFGILAFVLVFAVFAYFQILSNNSSSDLSYGTSGGFSGGGFGSSGGFGGGFSGGGGSFGGGGASGSW